MERIPEIVKVYPGRWLAHSKLGLAARAFVAADLVVGRCKLVCPTITQAARLARTNVAYVHWALRRQADREPIERGVFPLVPARASPAPIDWNEIDDDTLVEAVRLIGVDRTLNAAAAADAA
jgi:hypothetical protein